MKNILLIFVIFVSLLLSACAAYNKAYYEILEPDFKARVSLYETGASMGLVVDKRRGGLEEVKLKILAEQECKKHNKILTSFKYEGANTAVYKLYRFYCGWSPEQLEQVKQNARKQELEREKREKEVIEKKRKAKEERMRKYRERVEQEKIAEENRKKELIKQKEQAELEAHKNKFDNAKAECEEIGFKKGTEIFGKCVLDLTK